MFEDAMGEVEFMQILIPENRPHTTPEIISHPTQYLQVMMA
jgi:hypothetical protein